MGKLRELNNELECLFMQKANIEDKMNNEKCDSKLRWYKEYMFIKKKIEDVDHEYQIELQRIYSEHIPEPKKEEPKVILIKEEPKQTWWQRTKVRWNTSGNV